jgi:hypothetical protein
MVTSLHASRTASSPRALERTYEDSEFIGTDTGEVHQPRDPGLSHRSCDLLRPVDMHRLEGRLAVLNVEAHGVDEGVATPDGLGDSRPVAYIGIDNLYVTSLGRYPLRRMPHRHAHTSAYRSKTLDYTAAKEPRPTEDGDQSVSRRGKRPRFSRNSCLTAS